MKVEQTIMWEGSHDRAAYLCRSGYQGKKRQTRREEFLESMDSLIPGRGWRSAFSPITFGDSGAVGHTRCR